MEKVAIVTIGYNKINSLYRLLDSLNVADYGEDEVPLIISLDYCGSNKVEKAARKYIWKHGEKYVRTFHERQGLKNHILSCGDFLDRYENIYVFEDDIIVSPQFYLFGQACIKKYKNEKMVEGISLYAREWHQNSNFPFCPMKSEYDVYFAKVAQSWGQIWFSDRWKEFKKWYNKNTDFFQRKEDVNIPHYLYLWDEKSWLKYHMAYCAIQDRYFVYPYYSFTTAFSESGTHFAVPITTIQANLMIDDIRYYRYANYGEHAVYYDEFFENELLKEQLQKKYKTNVEIDLYGARKITDNIGYILSSQMLPFKIVEEYALQLRPVEMNILMKVKGKGIYLYDTSQSRKVFKRDISHQLVQKWNYFMRDRFVLKNEIIPILTEKIYSSIMTKKNSKIRGKK